MSKLFKEEAKELPNKVNINGRELLCSFCHSKTFWEFKTLLNQEIQSGLDLEFLSKKSQSYVCSECGLKLEFVKK